ncbi:membrane protein [Thalassotalea insulae]|uniref:Membrane protein n=1 Tax=Thalassotalea insulae TaxID=2056778 RepID=A0ABQ6GLH8_9GAMM|nr:MAPEG family protein [Thalassotalea insulae]GLX76868.1 membrane protein [Thalassotalea insulae]
MEAIAILQPVFVVALLTVVITFRMYITRVSTMKKLRIHPQKAQDTSHLKALLPDEVNRVANNYNHLFEQPTLFYVVCLAIALLGHVDSFFVICAWLYAGLRIAHSIVQVTVDFVLARFSLFVLSWLVLAAMIIKESLAVFTLI